MAEHSCFGHVSAEVEEEIEALKAIYEDEIKIDLSNTDVIRIQFSLSQAFSLNFFINGDYPIVPPSITCSVSEVKDGLETLSKECSGTPMLYTLISKANDLFKDIPEKIFAEELTTNNSPKKADVVKSKKKGKLSTKGNKKDESDSKKKPMRTAIDVINRILWDESLPTDHFIVGYLDRFIGVQEKLFSSFSWEDIASVDYNVLAIPKHRIQYFKYKNSKIWDKNERFDYVFGSTGHTKTLLDIMTEDVLQEQNLEGVKHCEAIAEKVTVESEDVKYNDRNRPNYFLCLPITNTELKNNLMQVQEHIRNGDDRLEPGLIQPSCFHITLCMFCLESEKDREKACSVLRELQQILVCMLSTNRCFLHIENVSDFRGLVVCAKVTILNAFNKFVEFAKLALKNAGIRLVGNYDPYTPHVTLLKLRRPMARELDMSEISPYLYKDFKDTEFGKQQIETLKICSTDKGRGDDGFYLTIGQIENALLCISDRLTTLISNCVTSLMSQGLILEDVGDEYIASLFSNDDKRNEVLLNTLEKQIQTFDWKPKKCVLILRGLPGSGKSYLVQNLLENNKLDKTITVCSADAYFRELSDEYKFSGSDIASAHKHCREQFINGLDEQSDLIIIDNSHTQCWEYTLYQRLAILCGYSYRVLEIPCENITKQKLYQKRCIHKVSAYIHEEMFKRWEEDKVSIKITSGSKLNILDIINGHFIPKQNFTNESILYSALFLDEESKKLLLSSFPPTHSIISADHMTISHSPSVTEINSLPIGLKCSLRVTSYVNNTHIQAVAVTEVDQMLQIQEQPHVTISRNEKTPAKDARKWLKDDLQWKPLKEMILTGLVGVQIATTKTHSVTCTQRSEIAHVQQEKDDTSHTRDEGDEEAVNKSPVAEQRKPQQNSSTTKKQQRYNKKNTHCENKATNAITDVGMYFGPRLVKTIYVFDFDSTLFHTPGPVQGRNDYKKLTGTNWPHSGWLGNSKSLQFPLQVTPGPTLRDYYDLHDRACSISVLLTGRIERVRDGVEPITIAHGMNFDRMRLKPSERKNEKREYRGHGVYAYKKEYIASLLNEFPTVNELYFFDDRPDNIKSIRGLLNQFPHIKFHLRMVQEDIPKLYNLTPEQVLRKMGRLPSESYKKAVIDSISFLHKAWMEVLSTVDDQIDNIKIFGSYPLGRKSDVDLCIFAPNTNDNSYYISALGEKLKSYGVTYIHIAAQIRCPRIRVKFEFFNSPPVECDITIATVLDQSCTMPTEDLQKLYKKANVTNKTVLEGLLFLEQTVRPMEARICLEDFGMIVDLVCVALEKQQLKGNVFHCIRTFHVVSLLVKFIESCSNEILPAEGLTTMKSLEKIFLAFMQYLSNITVEQWRALFKNFVPDIYIPDLIEHFKHCSKPTSTFENLLFTAPKEHSQSHNIQIKLDCDDDVELWRGMVLTEAYLGGCIRRLIDQGIEVTPGYVLKNMVCFSTNEVYTTRKIMEAFERNLNENLRDSVKVQINISS